MMGRERLGSWWFSIEVPVGGEEELDDVLEWVEESGSGVSIGVECVEWIGVLSRRVDW